MSRMLELKTLVQSLPSLEQLEGLADKFEGLDGTEVDIRGCLDSLHAKVQDLVDAEHYWSSERFE